jgi:hypothetical protein
VNPIMSYRQNRANMPSNFGSEKQCLCGDRIK